MSRSGMSQMGEADFGRVHGFIMLRITRLVRSVRHYQAMRRLRLWMVPEQLHTCISRSEPRVGQIR